MVYGYIRVSTTKQTVQNQKLAIKDYCRKNRLRHINWVSETISGTKQIRKRELGKLLDVVTSEDVIIITEISRLGRSMLMIFEVLQIFLEKGVKVIAIKEGFTIEDNIQTKLLVFCFGLSSELERSLLSERTKLGLERARKEGKHIGREKGQKPKRYKLTGKAAYIRRERAKGRSINDLANELCLQWSTLKKFMKNNKIN